MSETMSPLYYFQCEVGRWGEATFPEATDESIIAHLETEVLEVKYSPQEKTAEEIADCFMLLLHLAHRAKIDLLAVAEWKFAVNKKRKWGKIDPAGFRKHFEEPQ